MNYKLLINGEVIAVNSSYANIGRRKDCIIVIDEKYNSVSREHAAIETEEKSGVFSYKLIHKSQSNETYFNGRKVKDFFFLSDGDTIRLANGPDIKFIVAEKSREETLKATGRIDNRDAIVVPKANEKQKPYFEQQEKQNDVTHAAERLYLVANQPKAGQLLQFEPFMYPRLIILGKYSHIIQY